MVRKTSRSAALKATEKLQQSPRRRTRRRHSSSLSENSDEDPKKQASNTQATNHSSGNESDTDSKKPLKKRTRSKVINESRDVIQSKESKLEEVVEDDTHKGKSIDNNNQNNANEETENKTVQVTEKSPKEDGNGMDTTLDVDTSQTLVVDTSQTLVAELVCDNSEITTEKKEAIEEKVAEIPHVQETQNTEKGKTEELLPVKEKSSSGRKIKLHRLRKDSNTNSSEVEKEKKEEPERKKKISLKRPEIKQHEAPPKPEIKEQENSKLEEKTKIEELEEGEWGSTYEGEKDNKKGENEKPPKRIISLRRKKEGDKPLERSVSVPEGSRARKSSTDNIVINEGRRRRSVAEKSASENEEKPQKPKKPTKVVKLIRKFPEPQQDGPIEEKPPKKHKWHLPEHWTDVEIVNLEILKETCPEIDLLNEEEVNLEVTLSPERIEKPRHRLSFKELEEQEMENIEAELNEPEDIEIKENVIALNRKISIVDDTASKLKPPPSPPKNPVSEVLFITNLVRPFTVRQLKELLERTGKIREDGFWTDKIKSKCYVYYETAEEAEATRNALHGVHWPIGNGKQLIIDYSTAEDMQNAKNPPVIVPIKEVTPEKENKQPEVTKEDKRKGREERVSKREWDVGKDKDHHRDHRSKSGERKERERKHSRRSYTPEGYHGKKPKQEEPAQQRAMDDLFLKTKATPSIYWQPLSPEEIAEKQQQRQARLEANKRRRFEDNRNKSFGNNNRRDRNFRRR